ncbi:MAG TPA: M48 family metallopeptidase, partial [Burkholderiales bacterium]|nr:M48 family metallopeptidase [Burkholderiales bacterium]
HQKAADYTVAKNRLAMIGVFVHAAVLLAFTLGGGLQLLLDAWASAFARGSLAHGTAFLVSLALALALVNLPLALYRIFVVESRFGFNRITPRLFVTDLVKQVLLGLALGVPLILAVLWLMGRMGEAWWIWVWVLWNAFMLVVNMIAPTLILPLFNKLTPITEGEVSERVRALLERCGFKARGVFLMDGSKRSSHGNAFFAGFGAAKRIVLFDTLVERLEPPEVEAVLAHELGHYKLHHIVKNLAISAAVSLAGLWLLGQLIDRPWFYEGLGVSTPGTAAALALFLLVVPEFMFFLDPLASRLSRQHEFEADAYAVAHAERAELEQALVKLYRDNAATLTPDPLHSAFYDSHPPAAVRIARLKEAT